MQRRVAGKRTVARSLELARAFRFEQQDPDRFYELLSEDAVSLLAERVRLSGALAVDVGGGAGYLTRALRSAGVRCVPVDADLVELSWRGPPATGAVVADGLRLPLGSGSVDLAVSSNVLEHVREPLRMIDEMARVLVDGGHLWLSFTNWYGPWGGHETSPWHYLGGAYARRRYEKRTGRHPKNAFAESLFPLHAATVLRHLSGHRMLDVVDARPRYLPDAAAGLVRVPVVREVLTWNLEILARRRPGALARRGSAHPAPRGT